VDVYTLFLRDHGTLFHPITLCPYMQLIHDSAPY